MELDSFGFQAQTLLEAAFAWKGNPAAGSQHTVPWQPMRLPQGPYHLAGCARISSRSGHSSISRDLASRDLQNRCPNPWKHQ